MSKRSIIFSPRASQRLEEISDYLYRQQLSKAFVCGWSETQLSHCLRFAERIEQDSYQTQRIIMHAAEIVNE